jgi:hypothetical protein
MNLIEQAQSHYDGWRAAIVDRLANLDDNDKATNATILASDHEMALLALKCPSSHSALLKLSLALYYIKLYGPVGNEGEWEMVESALADLISEADLPSVGQIGATFSDTAKLPNRSDNSLLAHPSIRN